MDGLRSEFGGPEFQPHVTVVGAITLTEQDALSKFNSACEGLKAYLATVDRVAAGTFFYQCVYLLLDPTSEVRYLFFNSCGHGCGDIAAAYMPHLSLLYGDLTDEEKKKAQEKALQLDDSINSLSFEISSLELWKTDTEDNSLKSWEKISEFNLSPN
ncbi:unnamed protein product [Linum tenue]|uniref:RNA ligase/cyclic nucleotide phosphodiesterase family protein n=1 Tax=Linum tenue TaxID=586396 RepID=A0AAV0PYE3_9ROSI|nr:unnamed protein product [Linum tenue]